MTHLAAAIAFVVCDGGPANHLTALTPHLPPQTNLVAIYAATGPAYDTFSRSEEITKRKITVTPFSTEGSAEKVRECAQQIVQQITTAAGQQPLLVITDMGKPFAAAIHRALSKISSETPIIRGAYYDNPEDYVPGGFSDAAALVLSSTQVIFFANYNLANQPIYARPGEEIVLDTQKKWGIGYYPTERAKQIEDKRKTTDQATLRQQLFSHYQLADTRQKIVGYIGGNNEEYFNLAFPAFLSLLEQNISEVDFSNVVFLVHQHPGAKAKNLDKGLLTEWQERMRTIPGAPTVLLSPFKSSDDLLVATDSAFYYQTSMNLISVLAGVPTAQIGHKPYLDTLVRQSLIPSITTKEQLADFLNEREHPQATKKMPIPLEVGICEDYPQLFARAVTEALSLTF
jgi:hypothetical protein